MRSQSKSSYNEGNKQEKHVTDFAKKKTFVNEKKVNRACDQKT